MLGKKAMFRGAIWMALIVVGLANPSLLPAQTSPSVKIETVKDHGNLDLKPGNRTKDRKLNLIVTPKGIDNNFVLKVKANIFLKLNMS